MRNPIFFLTVLLLLPPTASAQNTTLAGEKLELPFRDGPHILLLSFSRGAGAQSRPWLEALEASQSDLPVYPVVVLAGVPGFVRRMVVRGIRGDVPKALHSNFVIVHKNPEPWRAIAPAANDDLLQVLLMQGDRLCYRSEGAVNQAAMDALTTATCPTGAN